MRLFKIIIEKWNNHKTEVNRKEFQYKMKIIRKDTPMQLDRKVKTNIVNNRM